MSKEKTKKYCIYKLTSPEDKVYIGMTSDLKRRWGGDGRKYIRSETLIGEKIYEYGWENFQKEILYSDLTEEEGSKKEREMITLYHSTDPESGYNR